MLMTTTSVRNTVKVPLAGEADTSWLVVRCYTEVIILTSKRYI